MNVNEAIVNCFSFDKFDRCTMLLDSLFQVVEPLRLKRIRPFRSYRVGIYNMEALYVVFLHNPRGMRILRDERKRISEELLTIDEKASRISTCQHGMLTRKKKRFGAVGNE